MSLIFHFSNWFIKRGFFKIGLYRFAKLWHPYVSTNQDNYDRIVRAISEKLCVFNYRNLEVCLTGTGMFQFFLNDRVFLYPGGDFSYKSIKKNYENYKFLKTSIYKGLVDYEFRIHRINGLIFYEADRLFPSSSALFDTFLKGTSLYRNSNTIFISPREVLGKIISKPRNYVFNSLFSVALSRASSVPARFSFGFVHGDLHMDNLMLNHSGNCVLIDLDRSMAHGPQFLDSLHADLNSVTLTENYQWYEVCVDGRLNGCWTRDERFIYFFYRVSREFSCDANPSFLYMARILYFSWKILRSTK